jgi:hypothetical protein
VCGIFRGYINKSPHITKKSLVISIMEVFSNILREDIKRTSNCYWSRLVEAVANEGDFNCLMENLYLNKKV